MVIGYPGHTDRYSSSYGVRFDQNVKLPISNRIRGRQMAIVDKWMNEDQLVRLKYSDWYFGLSNVQELYSGQVECCKRFRVADRKAEKETMLQEWILSDSLRKERWGNLLENLQKGYSAVEEPERQAGYYRETLIRGARISNYMRRAWNSKNPGEAMPKILEGYDELDMRVEHDLVAYAISEYVENVSEEHFGQWQKEVIDRFTCSGKCDTDALTDWLWNGSMFTSEEGLSKLRDNVAHEEIAADPLCRFMMEVGIQNFRCCIDAAEGKCRRLDLNREYTQALYQMNRVVSANPQADLQTLVQMQRLSLPVTPENIAQFEAYKNYQHQLGQSLSDMMDAFTQSFKEIADSDNLQEGLSFYRDVLGALLDGAEEAALMKVRRLLQVREKEREIWPERCPFQGKSCQSWRVS